MLSRSHQSNRRTHGLLSDEDDDDAEVYPEAVDALLRCAMGVNDGGAGDNIYQWFRDLKASSASAMQCDRSHVERRCGR